MHELSAPAAAHTKRKRGVWLRSFEHPSLRAKKYDESAGIWQARVTLDLRFYFVIEGDTHYLVGLTAHPK
jgi:hypothetical protein